ncbi:DUF1405 domain-containing protein [Paenibacillus sp. 1001270B_150601_E10]|uniref:DUF1405 domain-containing protein n=1 Tax=Paenibacillus sp. 1001270B_150601_E10 TaxID=2787079 RepID=UPI00189F89E5|nr:DUF1405 domain-containing protein [Paenibacillus sp. 1001270B_150601_E10]
MRLSFYWSRSFLSQRWVLWGLFIANLLGTIYGYYWYGAQLQYTWSHNLKWQIIFVPDSPTASLFFTLALLFLLFPMKESKGWLHVVRVLIEGLAVVTSVKYGIWACAIIFAGANLGEPLIWQDWMLVGSHLAMAVEALLFVRLFKFGPLAIAIAAAWTWLNDILDYTYDIFPWLPGPLYNHLGKVSMFTCILTGLSAAAALAAWMYRKHTDHLD